jgi:hypothetical protein
MGSSRAPIFYDYNNTGYYVDPATTSQFSRINADASIYLTGWFRNNNSNEGLYNQTTTQHWSSNTNGWWDASSTTSFSGIRMYTGGHVTTLRGSFYADNNNYIGILANDQNWALRVDSSKNVQIYGTDLTVGNSTSSNIYMTDTDENTRRIHCNSGRVGFLNTSNSWGAWCDNSGNWFSDFSVRAPVFYDTNDTTYYLDPNSAGVSLYIAGDIRLGTGGADTGLRIDNGAGTGDYSRIRFYQAGTNNQTIHAFSSNWQSGTLLASSTGAINLNGVNGVTLGVWNTPSVVADNNGNFYTKIFYDLNDTGYYVNPNGTSQFSLIQANNYIYCSNQMYATILYDTSDYGYYCDPNGTSNLYRVDAANQARSPIYYDANDTTYFADFNANRSLYLYGHISWPNRQWTWSDTAHSVINPNSLMIWDQYSTNGGSGSPVTYGTILHIYGRSAHEEDQLMFSYDGTVLHRNCFYGTNTWNGWRIMLDNSNYASYSSFTGAVYGTIYYDSDNTGYYVNPASTSVLNVVNIAGTYKRSAAGVGYLDGNYSSVETTSTTGPIYCISNSYAPTSTSLSSMYGVGYSYNNFTGAFGGGNTWGFYTSANGVSRHFLDADNGIGYASNSYRAPMFYDSNNTAYYVDAASTSNLNAITCVSLTETSSERYKENIYTLDNALDKVTSLRGVSYNRKGDTKQEIGVIAEEVAVVLPEVLKYNSDGEPDSVSYGRLTAILIEAIKQQQNQIKELQNEIKTLKQQ